MAMNRKQPFLICYDIADTKRLGKLHRMIVKQALMVQYSVYYVEECVAAMRELEQAITEIIDPRWDDVRIYPLPFDFRVELIGCCATMAFLPEWECHVSVLADDRRGASEPDCLPVWSA